MGEVREPRPVKPICGVTFAKRVDISDVVQILERILGPVEDQTINFDFSFTAYYENEMGSDIIKRFLSFIKLIHPGDLSGIKKKTNEIEDTWRVEGKRKVNIDPGYITGAKVVMASTKNFSHRIFLSDGIYGDVQLRFKQGFFQTSEWTYPDYQTEMALEFFKRVREKYISSFKKEISHEIH